MLSLGSSKPWPDAFEILTGQRKMEASALVEYFKPLQDWLEKKNKETGAHIGWDTEFGKTNMKTVEYIVQSYHIYRIFTLSIECLSKNEKPAN